MFGGRQHNSASNAPQQEHPEGSFYESFAIAAFPASHPVTGYQGPPFPADNSTWATAAGLPDDDDPQLQRRLQQLVEHHKPSTSRNVLRELADVAEQQSTPSGHKRKAYEEDSCSEDDEDDPRKLPPDKQRKYALVGTASRARNQIDDAMSKRASLRQSLKNLDAQIKALQSQYEDEKVQLASVEQVIQETSEELVDELLEDNTTWNHMYFHLVDFHNRHGHIRVPWRKEDKDKNRITTRLGPWLVQQRKDYRRDPDDPERLEPYKIVALEKINIEWEPFRQHWFNRFEDLKRYKEKHGDCRVPYCSGRSQKKSDKEDTVEDEEGEEGESGGKIKYDSLGVWVKRQRNQYKNYKAGNKEKAGEITEERIQLLESIGFEWSLRTGPGPSAWTECYNELKDFKVKNGHCRVDEKTNKQLSEWVKQMRNYLKRFSEDSSDNALTPEQYTLLKDLELDSSLRESKFETRFRELMDFKRFHGHCIVPAAYAANQKLSNWVQTQRRQYKLMKEGRKSQMTEEKYKTLTDAGFEFEVSKERKSEAMKYMDKSWDEFYAELEQYKAKYGQINSIKQRKKKALREWCDEQRVQHARMKWGKACSISEDQVMKLSELDFVWTAADTPSKGWDDYYGDLLTFYIEKSSFNIPDEDEDLKQWVETQKIEYKKFISGVPSLLTKSRIRKLSDVSFPLDGVASSTETMLTAKCSWEEMFGQLLVFKIHHKHFNVPTTMKELHAWTCQQRQQEKLMQSNRKSGSKRSAIWEERVRRLSEVGFDWDGELPPQKSSSQLTSLVFDHIINDTRQDTTQTPPPLSVALHQMATMNSMTFAIPNWATTMPSFLPNSCTASGRRVIAPQDIFQSMHNTVAAGKSLASQAAQIVADTNNRTSTLAEVAFTMAVHDPTLAEVSHTQSLEPATTALDSTAPTDDDNSKSVGV